MKRTRPQERLELAVEFQRDYFEKNRIKRLSAATQKEEGCRMPRRLLVAAEIVRDVAASQNASDRPELEHLASVLEKHALEIAGRRQIDLEGFPQLNTLLTSIRQIASAVDPESPEELAPRRRTG